MWKKARTDLNKDLWEHKKMEKMSTTYGADRFQSAEWQESDKDHVPRCL